MLVHPISMDPPPGNYTKSVAASNTEECHLILQEAVTKIATQSSISVSSTPSLVSSYTESDGTKSLSEMNVPARKKFTSMKKSLSKWGLQLSRKMSISSGINSHCESDRQSNAEKTKLRISSPLISSSSSPSASSLHSSVYSKSSSSSLQPDQANEEITRIIKNKELQQAQQQEENPEKSIMKFGQIVGPKRFGQQPGCLGDAGLDIRNCFNVATATEAIQCYAAEKVEIPSYPDDKEEKGNYYILPPYLEPTQFSELIKMKELVMAPHTEKCQIDPDMMSKRQIQQYEQDHYGSSHQEEEEEEEEDGALTDQQHHGNSTKRMLASSRHLRNVQRKSVQVSRDGRALLTFSK
ncbi:hypothetical protein FB192DRAFT_1007430 [Mucor lusitanicus]|uniref:Uncharacterized protein n=1 Tax=Mucor circinelloides f. lusitanicus TaxID=29924 RepID=A0A8H4F522_MUCCL|nr:hypothetical protein FB192DRAFT_1007430 [Mucor lusitanicus]